MGKTPTWEEFENKGPLDGKNLDIIFSMYKNLTWTSIYIVERASNNHLLKWNNLALEIRMGHLSCLEARKKLCIYFYKDVMNGWKSMVKYRFQLPW
jgi:hypothetical protein